MNDCVHNNIIDCNHNNIIDRMRLIISLRQQLNERITFFNNRLTRVDKKLQFQYFSKQHTMNTSIDNVDRCNKRSLTIDARHTRDHTHIVSCIIHM